MQQSKKLPFGEEDIRQLKRVRLRLKRRLNHVSMRLRDGKFASDAEDINFTLIEQQIISSRIERIEKLIALAKIAAANNVPRKS